MMENILQLFEKEGNEAAEKAAVLAVNNRTILDSLYKGIISENKRIKNASSKCLMLISRIAPGRLYPKFNYFVKLIESDDNILKWNAIFILGNLTNVDDKNKFNSKILEKNFALLYDKSMITAANTFKILGRIAQNKPRFRKKITDALLNVENLPFSSECRNILAGTALEAIEMYIDTIEDKKEIIEFAKAHLDNTRQGTKKKAEKFLKKIN